jgi:ABC-2 type transport system permease protein
MSYFHILLILSEIINNYMIEIYECIRCSIIIRVFNIMINSRLTSLIRKEFIHIVRDPRTLGMIFAIPLIQLFLLGYSATSNVKNIPLAVYDQNRSPESRALIEAYGAADYFTLAYMVNSESELRNLIENSKVRVGMIIPPTYSDRIYAHEQVAVAFILDGSDPSIATTALSSARLIGQAYATQLQVVNMASMGISGIDATPLEIRTQVWYNPDLVDAYFMVPGIIGMILYAITTILTATAIVRERERGTIEQLIVTPLRPWELMAGKIAPYVILALVDTIEVLVVGSLWFGLPIRSNLLLILALSSLFLITSLGIGLLASTIANTQQEAMLTVWLTLLPSIFLSGFFFPLEAMPRLLQWLSYAIPLRYYLHIIRSLVLKGTGVAGLQGEIFALIIFGAVLMTIATLRFRKRLD